MKLLKAKATKRVIMVGLKQEIYTNRKSLFSPLISIPEIEFPIFQRVGERAEVKR